MDTPHGKIIEETKYSMLYDEEFILLSESRQYFCTFSIIVAIWDNFLGLNYKPT